MITYITLEGNEFVVGEENSNPKWLEFGPTVTLWRKYRDGTESEEQLPDMLAKWTLAAIPECEPGVARAKIER